MVQTNYLLNIRTLFYNVELILLLIAQQKYKAEDISKGANKKSEQRKIKNEI